MDDKEFQEILRDVCERVVNGGKRLTEKGEVHLNDELYEKVWDRIRKIAVDAAPGSITPETMTRVCVDICLVEMHRMGLLRMAENCDG